MKGVNYGYYIRMFNHVSNYINFGADPVHLRHI